MEGNKNDGTTTSGIFSTHWTGTTATPTPGKSRSERRPNHDNTNATAQTTCGGYRRLGALSGGYHVSPPMYHIFEATASTPCPNGHVRAPR